MFKWIVGLIIVLILLSFAFKYNSFIAQNSTKNEETLSYKDIGKVLEDTRDIKDSRKEELERREKELDF